MKKTLRKIIFITLVCAFVAVPVQADLIQNGSFELGNFIPNSDNAMSLTVGSTDISGWTVVNDDIAWIKNMNTWGILTPYGSLFLDLTSYDNTIPHGGVSQTVTTAVGQKYTLSLDLGVLSASPFFSGPITVTVSADSTSKTFTYNPGGSGNQWQGFGFDFIADSMNTTVNITGISGNQYIGVDNISVVPVPVPGAVLLGSIGLGVAGINLRKYA